MASLSVIKLNPLNKQISPSIKAQNIQTPTKSKPCRRLT